MKNLTTAAIRISLCLALALLLQSKLFSQIYDINEILNGAKENPPVPTAGTGTIIGTYNAASNLISYTVTFSGLTGNTTAAHFHGPATPTTNSGVQIGYTGFPTGVTFGTYSNSHVLTATQETQLLSNQWYSNVHSNFAPGGEIRAHLFPKLRTLNLTYIIESFYNLSSMVPDTVNVNFRSTTSPYPLIEGAEISLNSSGDGSGTYSFVMIGTQYYIQVLHRNAVQTWSGAPVTFDSSSMSYDFTSAASQAFGNNLVLVGAEYCAYSGDANQDDIVDLSDITGVFNDGEIFAGGYIPTDINGDGVVDLSDLIPTFNNGQLFVGAVVP